MTYDLKALRDLEKRLAEAKGPDRELDVELHRVCFPDDDRHLLTVHIGCAGRRNAYTTEISAAVALVERVLPGWFWTAGKCKLNAHATVGPDRDGHHAHLLKDPTFDNGFDADMEHGIPALALCLSCVRALIAQEEAA